MPTDKWFTAEEDALIIDLKERQDMRWKDIKDYFPSRSRGTLQVRYCRTLKPRHEPRRPARPLKRNNKPAAINRGHLARVAKDKVALPDLEKEKGQDVYGFENTSMGRLVQVTKNMNVSMLSSPRPRADATEQSNVTSCCDPPTSVTVDKGKARPRPSNTPSKKSKAAITTGRTPSFRSAKRARHESPVRTTALFSSVEATIEQASSASLESSPRQQSEAAISQAVQMTEAPATVWQLAGPISQSNPPFPGKVPEIFLNPLPYMIIEKTIDGSSYRMRRRRASDGLVSQATFATPSEPSEAPNLESDHDTESDLSELMSVDTPAETMRSHSH